MLAILINHFWYIGSAPIRRILTDDLNTITHTPFAISAPEVEVKNDMNMREDAIINSKFLQNSTIKINNSKILKMSNDETYDPMEEEDLDVYPLSIKQDDKKESRLLKIRGTFIFLALLFIGILWIDVWRRNIFGSNSHRFGFFADKITTFKIPVSKGKHGKCWINILNILCHFLLNSKFEFLDLKDNDFLYL